MKPFAFRSSVASRVPYFVLLHTAEAPDATTWSQYVAALAEQIAQSKATLHVFAVTDGGGPDANQRGALAKAFAPDRHGSTTHVFTTSILTRGIVTAFQWVARSRAMAHHPDDFPSVCARCQVAPRAVLDDLLLLQMDLPPVALLVQLQRAVPSSESRGPQRQV